MKNLIIKRKPSIKKILVRTLLAILSIVILEVCLAMLPFAFPKEVSDEYKELYTVDKFYSVGNKSTDRAQIVETAVEALDIRIRMIKEAKESIVLTTFDIRNGGSTKDIFCALLAAADRGVEIRILVDGLYGMLHMEKDIMYYLIGTHDNCEIKFYNEPSLLKAWTINGRMHDKYLLVDGKMLLLGGRNTFDYFLGSYNKKSLSFDREIFVYNIAAADDPQISAITQVQDYFEAVYDLDCCERVFDDYDDFTEEEYKKGAEFLYERYDGIRNNQPELFEEFDYDAYTVSVDKITLVTNPTHIMAKEPYVWYELSELMKAAKKRVYIFTPYAVFSNDMYEDMSEIADKVADFTMLINSVSVGDNFMASSDYYHNKEDVLDTGVEVYEFQGTNSSHGKSILIDDNISVIGSYNLDMRSTYVDTEMMLVVEGTEFNSLLEQNIFAMQESSLKVLPDGSYEESEVDEVILDSSKRTLFEITSRVFQLFRYVI